MKILIVEDSQQIRKNLIKLISEIDASIVFEETNNSEAAKDLIKESKIDIIILDVELMDSNGFEILKFVKESESYNKTIVLMFSNHFIYKHKAETGKADYFFDKTNDLDKLLETINSLIIDTKN